MCGWSCGGLSPMHLNSRQPMRTIGTPTSYETSDNLPSAARGLGARSMTQSAVRGSSSEGSISTRRAAPLSRRSVAVKRTQATRPPSVSPTTGEGWKLTHLQRRRGRHRRAAVLHCVLHLREGAHLDLAHALARDAEFLSQLHERDLFLGEPTRLEDAPLALVEHGERIGQRLAAVFEIPPPRRRRLLGPWFVPPPGLPPPPVAVPPAPGGCAGGARR